jgi:hypothetical protein
MIAPRFRARPASTHRAIMALFGQTNLAAVYWTDNGQKQVSGLIGQAVNGSK